MTIFILQWGGKPLKVIEVNAFGLKTEEDFFDYEEHGGLFFLTETGYKQSLIKEKKCVNALEPVRSYLTAAIIFRVMSAEMKKGFFANISAITLLMGQTVCFCENL